MTKEKHKRRGKGSHALLSVILSLLLISQFFMGSMTVHAAAPVNFSGDLNEFGNPVMYYTTYDSQSAIAGSDDKLAFFNADGTNHQTLLASLSKAPTRAVLDAANNRIFIWDNPDKNLYSYDLTTNTLTLMGGISITGTMGGMIYDSLNEKIYYLTYDSSATSAGPDDKLGVFNIDGTDHQILKTNITKAPTRLVLDTYRNRVIIWDNVDKNVIAIDLSTSSQTTLSSVSITGTMGGFAYDPVGDRIFYTTVDSSGSSAGVDDKLGVFKADGTNHQILLSSISNAPNQLVLDLGNNKVWIWENASKMFYKYDLSTMILSPIGGISISGTMGGLLYYDGAAPTLDLAGSSPANNSSDFAPTGNLQLKFSEKVVGGRGTISLYNATTNTSIEDIPVNDSRITGWGTDTITINPDATLSGTVAVQWTKGAIRDYNENYLAVNNTNTYYRFSVEAASAVAPTLTGPTTMSLTEGYIVTSTGVYTITGTVPVTVTKTSGNASITWNDGTKKLDIATGLGTGSYPVVLTASNGTSPDATLTFTLTVDAPPSDTTAPALSGIGSSDVTQTSATVSATSNESGMMYYVVTTSSTAPSAAQVKAGQDHMGTAAFKSGSGAATAGTAMDFSVTGLTAGAQYYVYFVGQDSSDNTSSVERADFTTISMVVPTVSAFTPADNATGVNVNANLALTFSENVTAVAGKNIVIKNAADGSVVETIEATDATKVAMSGASVTINPSSTLLFSSDYYVQIDAGAFKDVDNADYAGIADETSWSFQTEIRTEVTAANSAQLKSYLTNSYVDTINLVNGTTYPYDGGTIGRNLTINGNGATIQAGAGVDDTVVRSDDITVDSAALGNYANVKTFLIVEGVGSELSLNDVTLQNGTNPIFDVINVKTGGSLTLDGVTLKDFHNNATLGNNLSFGIHAEPGAVSTTIQDSVFDSSNAFRNAVAIRNGGIQISGNTFEGTDYPERLKQSDGYEYAVYIYGGSGTITQNTISGYDSTTQQGYASAGIAVIGFYSTNVTITNNVLSYNESGIDVTQTWTPWTTNLTMIVNGLSLTDTDSAYVIGEAIKAANTQDYVGVSLNQGDEVELRNSSNQVYYGVLGGYRSPYLTTSDLTSNSVKIHFPTDAANTDVLNAAEAIGLEQQMDSDTTWTTVTPTWTGVPTTVTLNLQAGHTYRFRAKLTHKSHVDGGDPIERKLITYSNPVEVQTAALGSPTATGGEESIAVSGFTSGATLKLYITNGTLQSTATSVTEATYTFANVVPNNLGFYVTQTVNGEESENSSFVSASLRTPTAAAGIGYVDVSHVLTGATITLYDSNNNLISSSPTDQGNGIWRFNGLTARGTYYAVQSINGVNSLSSSFATVQPAIPDAPSATGGEESIAVSGFTSGATLKLYITNGTLQSTATSVTEATYTFANVVPNNLGFYVTQTVNGEESENSSFVSASLRTPTAAAGIGYVDVSHVLTGATITLYDSNNNLISSSPTDQGNGIWRFNGLTARGTYYAVQSINGVNSLSSSFATVQPAIPDAPSATGGEESIAVSGFTSGATLKLYITNGTLQSTATSVTEATYTFANVVPNNLGFYVTQTVNGEESENSSFVSASLRTPTAAAGIGYVDVSHVLTGATITLYDSNNNLISSSPTDQGNGIWRFNGLTARGTYYAVQSINGVNSLSSSFATVQPAIPDAPSATGGEESIAVSGFTSGATLKLYITNGTLQSTATSVTEATYTFANVVPNNLGFYVTQTVNGEESENSSFVSASLRTPTAAAGIGYVDVSHVLTGATITLYDSNNNLISSSPTDQGNGIWRFNGLTARGTYYAVQSINGVNSLSSSFATVQPAIPDAPSATGGEESIAVSGFTSGATLKLYITNGTLQSTATSVTEATYTFANVVPNNLGFYVTQTVNGEESENSSFVSASLRTPTAAAGIGYVDVSHVLTGATITLYDSNNNLISSSPTDQGNGIWRFNGLTAGSAYYAIQSVNGVQSINSSFASLPSVPLAPTDVIAVADNGKATIAFTAPVDNGGSVITGYEVAVFPGTIVVTGEASPITITGLTNGIVYNFTVKAINDVGKSIASVPSNSVTPYAPSNNSPSQPIPSTPEPVITGVDVLVNGKVENAGTATTEDIDGQKVTTVAVDEKKLQQRLEAEGKRAVITIPVETGSDVVIGELNGRMVKNMENQQAVVEIHTEKAVYTLSAQQINIDAISERFGLGLALQDIKVRIEIAKPPVSTIRMVEDAANREGLTLVVPPLNFKVSAVYGDQTEEVTRFNAYVERTVAIPEGIDPNRITTGVVVEPDGTVRHVPTKIVMIDGKYFAKINSLTNSTYSVIWHPLEFKDVENHWAKDAVNNTGSRMIVSGTGEETFSPNRDITRAEFATIMVRGLGLRLESEESIFTDVKQTDWYSSAIQTAYVYGLITGYEDGSFRPNDKITREQAMLIVSKAMKITELPGMKAGQSANHVLDAFSDVDNVSKWAFNGIADSVSAGIISGRSNDRLSPKAFITRAEVAMIMQRLLQKSDLINK